MNPEERRSGASIPENANGHNRQDGEVEFGDFEGFEDAAVASIPAAAGPSPWATFPDLLPVQTSPANPPNDEPICSGGQVALARGGHDNLDQEPWLLGAIGGEAISVGQHIGHQVMNLNVFNQVPLRAVNNPPDISLISACSASNSGAFNGLDPVSGDPRQLSGLSTAESDARHQRENATSLQVAEMRQQIEVLTSQRSTLEYQLAEAARERHRLAGDLTTSNARVTDLQATLNESQANARHQETAQFNANSLHEFASSLQHIRESLAQIQVSQAQDRQSIVDLQHSYGNTSGITQNKAHTKEEETERKNSLTALLESSCESTNSTELQQIIEHTIRKCLNEQNEKQDNSNSSEQDVIKQFKAEMQCCVEQTQELLEKERRKHMAMLSKTLQSALRQLSAALSSITLEDDDENSKGSKS